MDIFSVLSAVLGVVALLLGGKLVKIKNAVKEISDLPVALNEALKDDKITTDELKNLVKEAKEAIEAIKNLVK